MSINWSDIAFVPDEQVVTETIAAWKWLIPDPWKMVVCSMFGGIFFERNSGGVFWLECPTGDIRRVANSAGEFNAYLGGARDNDWAKQVEDWFLIDFVGRLHCAGKIPGPGQCYGLTILPVFEGGTYSVENVFVISAREWLTFTASMHEQLREIPDGSQVTIKFVD
jgi:hypothetical protein